MSKYNIQTDETTHIPGIKAGSGGGRSIELAYFRAEDIDSVEFFNRIGVDGENVRHPVIWVNKDIFFGQLNNYSPEGSSYTENIFDWLTYRDPLGISILMLPPWLEMEELYFTQSLFQNASSGMTFVIKDEGGHDSQYLVISKKLKKVIKTLNTDFRWLDDSGSPDVWSRIQVLTPVFDYEKTKDYILRFFEHLGIPGGPELFD